MHTRRFLSLLGASIVAAALPSTVLAQREGDGRREDQGGHQILQARYGTAARNIDVTERLQQLARRDRQVQITNDLFGNDPAFGETKTLRIYARSRDGATRIFEYREGDFIDGSQFTGWSRGEFARGAQGGWRGGWDGDASTAQGQREGDRRRDDQGGHQILQARYGTAQRNIDVTERLQRLARRDRQVQITNDLFGNDPAFGEVKTLRIYARSRDGVTRIFEYREGDFIDGSQFTGWSGGRWNQGGQGYRGGWEGEAARQRDGLTIISANYGTARRSRDVTERVRAMARNGRLDFEVQNDAFGVDPAPGREKTLVLVYTLNGQRQEVRVPERSRLTLP